MNMKILETERLILREYTMDDIEDLSKILLDEYTMRFYDKKFSKDYVERWIKWNLNNYKDFGFGLFVIIKKDTNEFIGDCGITIQKINNQYRPEVGYHINKNFWKQGYAKEAGKAVIEWAFKNTTFNTLYSYMTSENIPSQNTAKSIGMSFLEQYLDDGIPHHVYYIERN